ncbi:hypothetical protein PVAG01_06694 [Phlyctema vagabunda]|uniref:Uncharacterized protein n=1 Tax=Phlyctema vagabunda TaxID=108571 RepID=A0ABR4PGU2_9HELO
MSIMSNPVQKSPERAFALQKYLLLHSQHDALQRHLNEIMPSDPDASDTSPDESPDRMRGGSFSSSNSSEDSFAFSSPSFRRHVRGGSIAGLTQATPRSRRFSMPATVDQTTLGLIDEDETKLKNVNQQIKTTLTELLNCESVKNDKRYRMWVQTRLLDTEKELKGCKTRSCERRRSEDTSL